MSKKAIEDRLKPDDQFVVTGQREIREMLMTDEFNNKILWLVTHRELPSAAKVLFLYMHTTNRPEVELHEDVAVKLGMGYAEYMVAFLHLLNDSYLITMYKNSRISDNLSDFKVIDRHFEVYSV